MGQVSPIQIRQCMGALEEVRREIDTLISQDRDYLVSLPVDRRVGVKPGDALDIARIHVMSAINALRRGL